MVFCIEHDNETSKPRKNYFIREKNIEDGIPTTIEDLRKEVTEFPDTRLAERLMCFSSCLRGTKDYWNICHSELTDMISQIGFPTFFFTLSAAEWLDLHKVMPNFAPVSTQNRNRWRTDNVINYTHIVAKYMHECFSIFCEEIIVKYLHVEDYWYRYIISLFYFLT